MNRRYSWTSQSEDESDNQREPDWQEVRFPVKFPSEGTDDYVSREWSVDVTTPDQEIVSGSAKVRRDQVVVRFQPFQEGVHQVQILANGLPFCPPLCFDVLDDGSFRRIAAPPGAPRDGEQPSQVRSRVQRKRRERPSRGSASYSEDDDDVNPAGQRVVERRRRPRSVSADQQARYSGYLPSESDQYQKRLSRSSSVERSGMDSRPSSAARNRRDSSVDRPPSGGGYSASQHSVTRDTALSPRRHSRSVSRSSRHASPSPSGDGHARPINRGPPGLHRHGSGLSRQSSDLSSRYHSSHASSTGRYQRSLSDTESLLSRQSSLNRPPGYRHRTSNRQSRTSSHFSSADEADRLGAMALRQRRSLTTASIHESRHRQSSSGMRRHQSSSDARVNGPAQPRLRVSAFALGAVPAKTTPFPPPVFPQPKKSVFERAGSSPLPGNNAEEMDYEVMSAPRTGESFIVINSDVVSLRQLGKTGSGDQLVQSEDGQVYLIKHGRAFPMRQGYSNPGDAPLGAKQARQFPSAGAAIPADGKPRCCVCQKKATNPKRRAQIEGLLYCYKDIKELFFNKPPDSHKKFLVVDLVNIPSPGMPVHPRANFTALSFKEFQKAQEEFRKYDPSNQGAVAKDMIFPILKHQLTKHGVKEKRLQKYFSSQHYPKNLYDLQIMDDQAVSELQFLNLLALITRELTRKWLQKVKTQKTSKMMKAWSTTALDQAYMGGSNNMAMMSQSSIGLSRNFAGHQQPGMAFGQTQGFVNPSHAETRQRRPKHSMPAEADGHYRRKTSQSDWKSSRTSPRQRRRSDMPAPNHQGHRRSRSRDPEESYAPVHIPTQRVQKQAHASHGAPRARKASESSEGGRRRREDPEGHSRGDVSPTRSGTSSQVAKGRGVSSQDRANGGPVRKARSPSSPTGPQLRTSNAALTREEALAARARLQAQLQQDAQAEESDDDGESEQTEEPAGSPEQGARRRRPGKRQESSEAQVTGGHEPSNEEQGEDENDDEEQADDDDDDGEEEDEEEDSDEDSEQVLGESDEEELATQQEVEEMPITGNRMADAWMLY